MRRIKLCIMPLCAAMIICGCGKSECLLKADVKWDGFGVDSTQIKGERLDEYTVSVGDSFYELENGRLSDTLPTDAESGEYGVLFEITDMNRKGVTVIKNDGMEVSIGYGEKLWLDSLYIVYDGANYSYSLVFEK